ALQHREPGLLHAALLEAAVGGDVVEQRLGEQLALLQRRRALQVAEDVDEVLLGPLRHATDQVGGIFGVGEVLGRLVARAAQRQGVDLGAAAAAPPLRRGGVGGD